ncbi:BAT1 [Mytilus edulis]|uniref:SLC7A9_15 n=1 Tax=Mytilus edulis TaxID=6550 RepID=A0A8S3S3G1_MYTED|nr:BAT1 [Mytilus edulis]
MSIKFAEKIQVFMMAVKLVAAVIIVAGGCYSLSQGDTETLASGFEGTSTDTAMLVLSFYNGLWAYDGWLSYVAARDGHLPSGISFLHVQRHTPIPSMIFTVPLFIPIVVILLSTFLVLVPLIYLPKPEFSDSTDAETFSGSAAFSRKKLLD